MVFSSVVRVIEPVAYLGKDFSKGLARLRADEESYRGLVALIDSPDLPLINRNDIVGRLRSVRKYVGTNYLVLLTLTTDSRQVLSALEVYNTIPEVAGLCMYPCDTGQFGIRTRDVLFRTLDMLASEDYSGAIILHGGSPSCGTTIGLRTTVCEEITEWIEKPRRTGTLNARLHFPHAWAQGSTARAVSITHGKNIRQFVADPEIEDCDTLEGWYDAGAELDGYLREALHADSQPLWKVVHDKIEREQGREKADNLLFNKPYFLYEEKLRGIV